MSDPSLNGPPTPTPPMSAASLAVLQIRTWRARVVAAILVLGLLGACAVVWASPRTEPLAAADPPSSAAELNAENQRLQKELDEAKKLAEQRRIEAKAAKEREQALIAGQEKAAAERAAAAQADEAEAGARGAAKAAAERAAADERGRARAHAEQAAVAAEAEAAQAETAATEAQAQADELATQLALATARSGVVGGETQTTPNPPIVAGPDPSAPGETPAPTPAPLVVPTKDQILAAADGGSRWWGLYTEQAPFNWGVYDAAEVKAERKTAVAGYFQGWDGNFRPEGVERTWRHGQFPIMTWEARPLKSGNNQATDPNFTSAVILSGRYDAYLHQYARDIVALGLPLGIRLNHEMNGTWYPWSDGTNGNQVGDYAKVWRHVHDIFEQEGANAYVVWVWAPNIVNKLYRDKATLEYTRSQYPGDDYVDWMGLSGYSRPVYSADYQPTFNYTYGKTLAQLRQVSGKPILLAEVGASEIGGYKPGWVKDFFTGLARPENSDIIGFVWFDLAITTYAGGERITNDWRIDSRGDTLENFRTGLNDPASGFDPLPTP